jgi:putative oxidoreductase
MTMLRAVARPMLASMFALGGARALKDAESQAVKAKPVTDRIVPMLQGAAPSLPIPSNPATWVRIHGAVNIVGAGMLATGRLPRVAALVLAAGLGPATVADHPFWRESDPQARAAHRVHFFKNVSMAGGLLLAAVDRPRRPKRKSKPTSEPKDAS